MAFGKHQQNFIPVTVQLAGIDSDFLAVSVAGTESSFFKNRKLSVLEGKIPSNL